MPTTIEDTIGTGGDYSDPATWEAAITADLVAADELWRGKLLNEAFGGGLTIAGQTTDATRYVELTCNAGASFSDNPSVRSNPLVYNESNGAAIKNTGAYATGLSISTARTRITGIQLSAAGGSSSTLVISASNCLITDCIIDCDSTRAARIASGATGIKVNNSLIQCTSRAISVTDGTWEFNGCTFIGTSVGEAIESAAYTATTLKNCAVFGFTSIAAGGGTLTYTYCGTDLGSLTGTGNVVGLTFADQFESTTVDFRAVSTGDLQAGTPDATNTPDDITGLTRDATTPWIGAWEVSGGGRTTKNTRSHPLGMRLGMNWRVCG